MLVLAVAHDPVTGLSGAERAAEFSSQGHLVTVTDAWGHGVLDRSTCASEARDEFLVGLTTPSRGTCAPDAALFSANGSVNPSEPSSSMPSAGSSSSMPSAGSSQARLPSGAPISSGARPSSAIPTGSVTSLSAPSVIPETGGSATPAELGLGLTLLLVGVGLSVAGLKSRRSHSL
jgi:hypothetical protein